MLRLLLISLLLAAFISCGGGGEAPSTGTGEAGLADQALRKEVEFLYPSERTGKLVPLRASIEERGDAQLDLEALLREYLAREPGGDMVNPFPENTTLRAVFLMKNGTAVVDLGPRAAEGGGTETECFRVYGIVNTVCANFEGIRGVKFLVDGQERDTLMGHVSLERTVPPEPGLNGEAVK